MKTIRQSIANPLRTDSPRYGGRWRDRSTVGSGVIVNQVALSYNAFNRLIGDAQSHSGAVTGSTPKVGYSYANGTGVIQERHSYKAFGLATVLTPGFTARAVTNFAWNFLFHGQFRDVETGWDNYGFRYYLPWLGRWTDRDPIEEDGGENLYAMAFNDAVNLVDFLGLAPGKACCPKKGDERDDYNTCRKKGTLKPNPADSKKCQCPGKDDDDKDKKKGFLGFLHRCKFELPKTEETYKGNKITPTLSAMVAKLGKWKLSVGARVTAYDRAGYSGTEGFLKLSRLWPCGDTKSGRK